MDVKRLFDSPYYQVENFPKEVALACKVNGTWKTYSTKEYIDLSNQASLGLLELGVAPGDTIAMITNNRPEWNIMDIGIGQIGAINVPVYPTVSENDYKFIFNDAGIKYVFVSDTEILAKVNAIKAEVPTLKGVYSFNKIEGVNNWMEVLELAKPERMQDRKSVV